MVLALGAGVSAGSGLPQWTDLLRFLARRYLTHPRISFDYLVRYCDENPTMIAGMVRQRFSSQRAFGEAVRQALYSTGPFRRFFNKDFTEVGREFVQQMHRANPTMHAVASLCVVPNETSPGSGVTPRYFPNPAIRAIINFNFDALLRLYVHGRFGRNILRTIDRASAGSHPRRISLYHVHGYLRFLRLRPDSSSLRYESPDLVVLAEEDYFDFFDRSGSVFNYSLRYLLREYTVLFVGMSMKDVNLRRILHYSMSEQMQSRLAAGESTRRNIRHFAILNGARATRTVRHYAEIDLRRLGVQPLWIESFDEIPRRLGDLYGPGWPSVHGDVFP
jgi:hypothetical protein